MKIFISWSGQRSKLVADELHRKLPLMLPGVEPWLSSEDIRRGKTWAPQLAASLMESNFGILCLTPENIREPFVLFEAGALAKNVEDSHVCTYLLGLQPEDIEEPLGAFQATPASQEETWKLVQQIREVMPEPRPKESRVNELFGMCWPQLKTTIDHALRLPCPRLSTITSDSQAILEEIRQSVRSLCDESKVLHVLSGPMSNVTGNRVDVASLPLGSLVRHPQLGLGRILQIMPIGGILRINIYFFEKSCAKTLPVEHTHLEPWEEPMPSEVSISGTANPSAGHGGK